MKNSKMVMAAAALALSATLPQVASADMLVLDTGSPGGTGAAILSTNSYVAGEFALTAGETVTGLGAYLTKGTGQQGDTFVFDIYADGSGFTQLPRSRENPLFSVTGTYTHDGWNSAAVDWTALSNGNYWLALQVSSTTQTKGLDVPFESVGATGPAPALGFATAGTSHQYAIQTPSQAGFGLQVTVSQAPLPAAAWLLLSGCTALAPLARRRRPSSTHS